MKKLKKKIKLLVLLALVIFAGVFFEFSKNTNEGEQKILTPLAVSIGKILPTATMTPSPTPRNTPAPTAIPTPTPVPLIGYCLNVPVLFYHHVQPQSQAIDKGQIAMSVDNGMFDHQMEYLKNSGYTPITVKQLIDALITHFPLPPKSIAVTLDDGYKDVYDYAFPVFKKYNMTANLMIATGLLGGANYMSWDNLKDMHNSGLIYVTDHTWSHYAVNNGSEEKIKYEIEIAKRQLEDNLGQIVDIFTYPYGSFNNTSVNILKQDGFVGAFSTIPGNWQCDSFIMTLHRKRIGNSSMAYYRF